MALVDGPESRRGRVAGVLTLGRRDTGLKSLTREQREGVRVVPTHGECGKSWSGGRACHCGGCHETFSGIKLFDQHRSLRGGEHGSCADPSTMRNVELRDGVWSSPEMGDAARASFQDRH